MLSNIVFVPLYLRLMGAESYGLVVAYATVIASLQVLDAGWTNLLSRQLALRMGHDEAASSGSPANLVRTIECVSWSMGVLVGASCVVLAPLIAEKWFITKELSVGEITDALRLMGLIIAIQWPSMAYQGAMIGLQEQVSLNVIRVTTSSLQALGAAFILWKISHTVEAFFVWVLLMQTSNTFWMRWTLWKRIAVKEYMRPRFDWNELTGSWRFALGVAGIALISSVLTQADKIVLSRSVPLEAFAIYGVAYTVCGVLGFISGPILQAVLPPMTQQSVEADDSRLRRMYLHSSELVAFIVVPAWMTLTFHAQELMSIWMGAGNRANMAAALIPVLAAGSLLNAIVTLPYGLQIAHGWTSLSVTKNVITVAVSFPALLWAVQHYGTMGAAAIWAAINASYLLFEIPIMHRRILKDAMGVWYLRAVAIPVGIGIVAGLLSRRILPPAVGSTAYSLLYLSLSFAATAAVLAAVLPAIRRDIRKKLNLMALTRG